jgi:CubicO group peptidase (beta-lactamase class C family)
VNAEARAVIDAAVGTTFTACVLAVDDGGARDVYAAGTLCPDPSAGTDGPCTVDSLFDLASLSKLATTALTLMLVRERVLALDMPLREIVPDFRGGAKDRVTLQQVLTHTAGLNWWKPLWKEASSSEEAVWLAAQEPLARDPGEVVYSDLGYVMLTAGLAKAGGAPFGDLVRERVIGPLEARDLDYGPRDPERCAATELDETWRHRRLRGEVHDENAHAMGGVSGHAGLFGTAADVLALSRVFREGALIGNDLAALARMEHARTGNQRRGLGLALLPLQGAQCGRYFSEDSFGHSGYTGNTLWVDPRQDLTVVLLTNRVYFGRAEDPIYRFRIAVHEAVSAPNRTIGA